MGNIWLWKVLDCAKLLRLGVLHIKLFVWCVICITTVVGHAPAHAQLQRSIVNPSFEDPFTGPRAAVYNTYFGTAVDWVSMDRGEIPGWETSHPLNATGCPAGGGAVSNAPNNVATYSCNPIELWFNGFLGVTPAQGARLAELNAYVPSKLFQNICLNNGETFNFDFAHRGRSGIDSTRFETTASPILTVATGNTGSLGAITATGAGTTGATAALVAGGWTRYSGTFTYSGATSIQQLGFIAVSSVGGPGIGNLIDDVNITLKPYAELTTNTFSVEGAIAPAKPQFRFVGRITVPTRMTLTFAAPVADYTSDFDFTGSSIVTGTTVAYDSASRTGTLSFTIPVGNYSADNNNTLIDIPLRVIDDSVMEDNEVINFAMPSSPSFPYVVANSTICGGVAITTMSHTIIDNDINLRTSKSVSSSTTTLGGALAYTVTFANISTALTVAPLTAHDAVGIVLADAVPPLASFTSWVCTGAGGAVCPAASGSGAIAASANLPRGSTLTYVVNASITSAISACASAVTNTATQAITSATIQPINASFPVGTLSLALSQQGSTSFVVGPVQAVANSQIVACTSLAINKTNAVASVAAGGTTAYTITATNSGPFDANGARVLDLPSAGLACSAASCTATLPAVCPALTPPAMASALLTAPGLSLASFPANSALTFTIQCNVTATGQ